MKQKSSVAGGQPSPTNNAAKPIVEPKLLAAPKASPATPIEISMRGFVKELRRIDQLPIGQTFVFLLGAGASVTSGIDGAATLADVWLRELHELDPNHNSAPFHQWLHDRRHGIDGLDPKNLAASYSAIFDRRFAANPSQGFAYLTKLMQDAQPGFGYSVLATLIAKSKHKAVVTTNFDSLVERALLYYTDATPLTCTDETAAGTFDKDLSCPLIIKCHRDLHLHPHNGVAETSALHENFGKALHSLLPGKVLIAVGYGGNDPSLMGFLEGLRKEERPSVVYWCYWGPGGLPGQRILDWVASCNGRLVAIPGFDELMSGVKGEFGYDLLEQEMETQHKARVKRYKDQVEQIASKKTVTAASPSLPVGEGRSSPGVTGTPAAGSRSQDKATVAKNSDAVDFASESITKGTQTDKGRKSAWSTIVSILPITDHVAKEAAFKKAMADYPGDATVAEHYADFLRSLFRFADAARLFDDVIVWTEARQPADAERAAKVRAKRARVRWLNDDLVGAEEDVEKAIAWREAQFPRDERGQAIDYALRARIRSDRGLIKEVEDDIARAIALGEAQSPRDERALAIRYADRANIRQLGGFMKEAEEDIAKSLAWEDSQTPPNQRDLAIRYASRASIRRDCGLLKEAAEDIERSIVWLEGQSPRDERSLAACYALRARIRRDQRLYPQALADIEHSLATANASQPLDDWGAAIWSGDRSTILVELDRVPQAVADMAACIAWHRQHQPENRHRLARCLRWQARILAVAGQWDEAKASIDESVAEHIKAFGKDHEWTVKAVKAQADVAAKKVPER